MDVDLLPGHRLPAMRLGAQVALRVHREVGVTPAEDVVEFTVGLRP